MDAGLTVYEKPTCSTCRKLFALLDRARRRLRAGELPRRPAAGEEDPLAAVEGGPAPGATCCAGRSRLYASLALAERDVSDDELIALMAEHPELLQRPIVERGDRGRCWRGRWSACWSCWTDNSGNNELGSGAAGNCPAFVSYTTHNPGRCNPGPLQSPAAHGPAHRHPQRGDHRPRRPRQDHSCGRHAAPVRRLHRARGRAGPGHGLDGPGARARASRSSPRTPPCTTAARS